jgi:transposase
MTTTAEHSGLLDRLLAAATAGELAETQWRQLHQLGPEAVTLVGLATGRRIVELQARLKAAGQPSPSTPSGQVPIYTKPSAPKRRRRPGARRGHTGSRRPTPDRIDRREEHQLAVCPCCGGPVQRCKRVRKRIIEDIPADIATEVVEHTIHRDYCPACKKHVEPVVADALPNATVGHRLVAMTSWLHYGLGVSIEQVRSILTGHLRTELTAGGLVSAWQRTADLFLPWYQQIAEQAKASAVLHADETGWRVNGLTHWLWCFANKRNCFYLIDRSRGGPALAKFFTEAFDGVLVRDFWAAYDALQVGEHQCCLVHLLRELEKVDLNNTSAPWQAFAKQLRRLIRDGIRLRKRPDFEPDNYVSRIVRIDQRLMALAHGTYADADARRLAARLLKYCDSLFTFLDHPEVPFENNLAERMIRPAVLIRKNSQSNRSDKGAATQAVLMSIYRTLKLRGHNPMDIIADALRNYLTTGQLPPLPVASVADG